MVIDSASRTRVDYEPLREIVRNAGLGIGQGILPSESEFRRVWAGVFRNESEQAQGECRSVLLRALEEIASIDPEHFGVKLRGWEETMKSIRPLTTLSDPDINPFLNFGKGELVVFPNLVGGFPVGGAVVRALRQLDKDPADTVLIGYSKNGETHFEDGDRMEGRVYIHREDAERVRGLAEGRAALIVDDFERHGITANIISSRLYELGFRRTYKTTGREVTRT